MDGQAREGWRVGDASINYREALVWLYSLQRFGIKLGLENIERLLDECCSGVCVKRPALAREASTFKVIHVARYKRQRLRLRHDRFDLPRRNGYRTGLFTSPHLVTFRERIRVNGDMISEDAVAHGLTTIRNLVAELGSASDIFRGGDRTCSQALLGQRRSRSSFWKQVSAAGSMPRTRFNQMSSVITPIDFDHENWLGKHNFRNRG